MRSACCIGLIFLLCQSSCASSKGSDGRLYRSEFDSLLAKDVLEGSRSEQKVGDGEKEKSSANAQYNFLRGELALGDENFDSALGFFERSAAAEAGPAPLLRRRLAQLYIRKGDLERALEQINIGLTGASRDAGLLRLRGGLLTSLKRHDEAVSTYRSLIEVEAPNNEDAYTMLASVLAQSGDLPGAKAVVKELIKGKPRSGLGYYYLGRLAETSGALEEAKNHYLKAFELAPEAEVIQADLVRVMGSRGDEAAARKFLLKQLKKNPSNLPAQRLLGQLFLKSNRFEEALGVFEALGRLEDDPTDTRFKIALIKVQQGKLDAAIDELNIILADNPKHSGARYYLATVYAAQKRTKDALEQIAHISPRDRIYGEARVLQVYLLQQAKQYAEARDVVDELLVKAPSDLKLLSFKAMLCREQKDFDCALGTMQKVVDREPKNEQHLFNLGVIHEDAGDRDGAEQVMEQLLKLNPRHVNALNYLAYSFAEQNRDLEQALVMINQALEIEKDNGFFIDTLGWIYFRMGRFDDAERELRRAVAVVANDAVVLEHLGVVLLKAGKTDEAAVVLKRALENASNSDDKDVGQRVHELLDGLK